MRKAKPKKRVILPDPVFGEVMVAKFVNHLMLDGKKNTAYSVFYTALEIVTNKMKSEQTALEGLETSLRDGVHNILRVSR